MAEKLFYIGIKALIENKQGELLLFKADVSKHRKNKEPYWDIPGGRIDEDETDVLDTLKREIYEETGIKEVVSHEFFTAVISNHQIPKGDKLYGLALMIYKVSIPEGSQIRMSQEHVAYEWVGRSEARKRLSHKYPKEFTDLL
ncbi:MAG TPA: NUDIX hydrolase [Candidatus Saccharimonadales bacterium]|nr:NUDIX hydrolase [Candidatus Saccharimonadales bacterium]